MMAHTAEEELPGKTATLRSHNNQLGLMLFHQTGDLGKILSR